MTGIRLAPYIQIARLTSAELARTPITLLLTGSIAVCLLIMPLLMSFSLGEPGKLVRDSSLALTFLGALLLAAASAANALQREVREGTTAIVLSKPVSRSGFLFAKFAGVVSIMFRFLIVCLLCILIGGRMRFLGFGIDGVVVAAAGLALIATLLTGGIINFITRRSFISVTSAAMPVYLGIAFFIAAFRSVEATWGRFGSAVEWAVIPLVVLLFFAAVMLQVFSLLVATRMGLIPTVLVASALFIFGLLSDALFAQASHESIIAGAIYTLLPNWQHFWMADAIHVGQALAWSYVGTAAFYCITWVAGVFFLAAATFHRMEVR